jgi:acetyl-CoA carboxylase biotin carboxyl carrier protein
MEPNDIRRVFQAMQEAGFQTIRLDADGRKLRLKLAPTAGSADADKNAETRAVAGTGVGEALLPKAITILSERVGVFGPGKKPIQVGEKVKKGDILGEIKGISIQDQIICSANGLISQVCVRPGEIIEFGKPLFVVEPIS